MRFGVWREARIETHGEVFQQDRESSVFRLILQDAHRRSAYFLRLLQRTNQNVLQTLEGHVSGARKREKGKSWLAKCALCKRIKFTYHLFRLDWRR